MEESMNQIEQLYSEAKDEIEYAEDSQGTTYYHEDLATAGKAVDEVFDAYDKFIQSLPTEDMKKEVKQKVDLKMEELKMAFAALPEESD
ncbi:hypothetical protein BDF20DRAFT_859529 [Mycotypha africana]|uniref:uncharacterized protein n=1 Tax=Mycotypha africana TaxID=64632 RepID=UPI002300EE34|nr:uncharacterized protein BDF20DRAFT_859529 [Mycotypha africana]KAI8984358.1 hypothetical protein BDF20DRAFT_859529 [Mycotypha africana]